MNLQKGNISGLQLMILISSYILGSILFVSFADTITKHDTWLVIVSAYAMSIPFILSYVFLVKRFPGRNLVQINDIIYGPYLGKFISILYSCFFLLLLSLDLKSMSDLQVGFITPEMPNILFLVVCSLVCAYAVRNGIETISRISFVIFVISALNIIFSFLLLLKNMDFSNFLPVFELPLKDYFQGVHVVSTIIFSGILVFLMVMPNLNSFKYTGKYALLGLTVSALLLTSVTIRNTAVLGVTAPIYVSDSYQAFRLIDIGNTLTKMDILFGIGVTLVLFLRICVIYYATVTSMAQILNLRSHSHIIIPLGIIAVCLSMILFNSLVENYTNAKNYHPILAAPFEFILPPLSLLIAKIRKLPKQKGGKSE